MLFALHVTSGVVEGAQYNFKQAIFYRDHEYDCDFFLFFVYHQLYPLIGTTVRHYSGKNIIIDIISLVCYFYGENEDLHLKYMVY